MKNQYQVQFKRDGLRVCAPTITTLETARHIARAKAYQHNEPVEVVQINPHPLESFGVSYANPVLTVGPKDYLISHESKANLSGHGGGDVRTSSCDPRVYPWVLFERGLNGDRIGAVHPTYGDIGPLGSTRAEAITRLSQLDR